MSHTSPNPQPNQFSFNQDDWEQIVARSDDPRPDAEPHHGNDHNQQAETANVFWGIPNDVFGRYYDPR